MSEGNGFGGLRPVEVDLDDETRAIRRVVRVLGKMPRASQLRVMNVVDQLLSPASEASTLLGSLVTAHEPPSGDDLG